MVSKQSSRLWRSLYEYHCWIFQNLVGISCYDNSLFLGGLIGGLIGRKVMKKHFEKSGLV